MLETTADRALSPEHRAVTRRPLRPVTVCAQHALVGEAVRAALAGSGLAADRLAWDDLLDAVENDALALPVLLMCELDPADRRRAAVAAVHALDGRCVVLTDTDPGAAWGAVLEAGAASVLPSSTAVESVVVELDAVARGEQPFDVARRLELVAVWSDLCRDQVARTVRVERLSPRERSVLEQLHLGRSVPSIAEDFGVAESTVRSQVRRLFAKLEVRSQLAAVAVYAGYVGERGE